MDEMCTSHSFSIQRVNIIKKYLELEYKRILDVGCGIGDYAHQFQINGLKEVIALDVKISDISVGHSKYKNIHYIIGDGQNISIRNSMIELVFINEVLEHVPNDESVIHETNRVLKNEGYLILFAPNKLYPWESHFLIGNKSMFPFLSWAPTTIRKCIFTFFKRNYITIYTKSKLRKMLYPFYKIIDIYEILPSFNRYKKRKSFKKIIRIIESFSETPLKRFGVSIFVIAKKRTRPRARKSVCSERCLIN